MTKACPCEPSRRSRHAGVESASQLAPGCRRRLAQGLAAPRLACCEASTLDPPALGRRGLRLRQAAPRPQAARRRPHRPYRRPHARRLRRPPRARHRALRRPDRARRRGRASASSSSSPTPQGDRLFVPVDQADRVARYVGPGELPARPHAPRQRRVGARRASACAAPSPTSRRSCSTSTQRARCSQGHAFSPDTPWQQELEASFPYVETPDQLEAIARRQARHGGAAADGPPDLRRRRLRQDGGRDARRLQGRDGRLPGRRARADDRARPAALQHLQGAPRRLPARVEMLSRFLSDKEAARGRRRASRRAASTSSSARTASSRRTSSSRTSASWSSTRSSASASRTRSASSRCARRSTC